MLKDTLKKDCSSIDGNRHKINIGLQTYIKDCDKCISSSTKELRDKYKDRDRVKEKEISLSLNQRYRIPPKLIE